MGVDKAEDQLDLIFRHVSIVPRRYTKYQVGWMEAPAIQHAM